MIIDNCVEKTIGGTVYKFCYPFEVLFKAEQALRNQNMLLTLGNMPISMADTYTLFRYALIGGGFTGDIDEVFHKAVHELGYVGMFQVVVEALQKSGAIGNGKEKNV